MPNVNTSSQVRKLKCTSILLIVRVVVATGVRVVLNQRGQILLLRNGLLLLWAIINFCCVVLNEISYCQNSNCTRPDVVVWPSTCEEEL